MRENIPLVKAPRRASGPLVGGMQCNGPRERVGVHRVLCDHYVVLAFGINNPSRSLHPVRKILLPEVEIDRLGLPGRKTHPGEPAQLASRPVHRIACLADIQLNDFVASNRAGVLHINRHPYLVADIGIREITGLL